jgi:hypothetical protein
MAKYSDEVCLYHLEALKADTVDLALLIEKGLVRKFV